MNIDEIDTLKYELYRDYSLECEIEAEEFEQHCLKEFLPDEYYNQ